MKGRSAAFVLAAPAPTGEVVRLKRYPEVPECVGAGPAGPCAHEECRYHLAHRGYWDHHLKPTRDCALDVANEGPHTLEQVAAALGVSVERVRQVEEQALGRLKQDAMLRRLHAESTH
jgi:hypothetical protein